MFEDRADAGRQLAELLDEHDIDADVVLAIPRGGLPVGRAVADALDCSLDIVAARKLGAPGNPEFAIGAVAADGTTYVSNENVSLLRVGDDYIDDAIEHERAVAEEKVERYRQGRPPLDLQDKTVVVVDDGVATGATTIACLRQIRHAGAGRVVLAIPVGPPDTIVRLQSEADEVVCVETPPHFMAVGQFYDEFGQVTDEEAMRYLD